MIMSCAQSPVEFCEQNLPLWWFLERVQYNQNSLENWMRWHEPWWQHQVRQWEPNCQEAGTRIGGERPTFKVRRITKAKEGMSGAENEGITRGWGRAARPGREAQLQCCLIMLDKRNIPLHWHHFHKPDAESQCRHSEVKWARNFTSSYYISFCISFLPLGLEVIACFVYFSSFFQDKIVNLQIAMEEFLFVWLLS